VREVLQWSRTFAPFRAKAKARAAPTLLALPVIKTLLSVIFINILQVEVEFLLFI
jgi:hypothetical protein